MKLNYKNPYFDTLLTLASLELINSDFLTEIKATLTLLSIHPEKLITPGLRIPAEDETTVPFFANEN